MSDTIFTASSVTTQCMLLFRVREEYRVIYIIRMMACNIELFNQKTIASFDHLVKKEVVVVREHLSYDGLVADKPGVDLLCGRRIEDPVTLPVMENLPLRWIAVLLAVLIRLLML